MNLNKAPWWKGKRGEWYVVIQIILILLLFFGPREISGWPENSFLSDRSFQAAGIILITGGLLLFALGLVKLGSNLTPVPYPKDEAKLVETGPYSIVRHPIYSGGIIASFGWALLVQSWLTLVYAGIIFLFFDIKSRREEQFLRDKFPDYEAYQKRVRKLIPFVY